MASGSDMSDAHERSLGGTGRSVGPRPNRRVRGVPRRPRRQKLASGDHAITLAERPASGRRAGQLIIINRAAYSHSRAPWSHPVRLRSRQMRANRRRRPTHLLAWRTPGPIISGLQVRWACRWPAGTDAKGSLSGGGGGARVAAASSRRRPGRRRAGQYDGVLVSLLEETGGLADAQAPCRSRGLPGLFGRLFGRPGLASQFAHKRKEIRLSLSLSLSTPLAARFASRAYR